MSPSLIGRLGSSTFRLTHRCSVDVARGLALLFGIGTRALVWGFFCMGDVGVRVMNKMIASVTFIAILMTILIQAPTTKWLGRKLGLLEGSKL